MSDKFNSDSDPKDIETEYYDAALTSELYLEGKNLLWKNDFLIIPDSSGVYAYHKVYHLENPYDDEISYPDNFKVWAEISNESVRMMLQNIIAGWNNEELKKFWWPFIAPNKNRNSPLYMYTELMLNDRGIQEKKDSGKPYEYYQTPIPVLGETKAEQKKLAPRVWVPLEDWFPEAVKQVSIHDILTIFPESESELLSMILGRAVVGRNNHLPPGWSEPIKHTSRMAALTLGEDPGLGKTTLFKTMFSALETCGFVIETFDKFNSQFNMGPILLADIVYRDDLADADLASFIKSGVAKSTISGSDQVKVQDKGIDAFSVFPRATIVCNTNNFNPRLVWGIDPGMADRIKLLATLREAEIPHKEVPELSKGSPDLRPFLHLEYLSQKIGVSVRVIMLWFARLCADKFLALIQDRTSLEIKVDYYSLRLREPLHKDSTSQLMTFVLMIGYMSSSKVKAQINAHNNSVSGYEWGECFQNTAMVLKNRRDFRPLLEWLAKDFQAQEIPDSLHPAIGATILDPSSLQQWTSEEDQNHADKKNDMILYLKEAMKYLRMRNGLHFSSDEVWLTKAFSKIFFYIPQIRAIIEKMESQGTVYQDLLNSHYEYQ